MKDKKPKKDKKKEVEPQVPVTELKPSNPEEGVNT